MASANDRAHIASRQADSTALADERFGHRAAQAPARPRALVSMHWLTVLCLVLAAIVILTRDEVSGKPLRQWLLEIHRHLGLCVLLLFALRIALRLRLGRLPALGRFPWPMRVAASLTHAALYLTILALPVLGWMLSDAEGKPVHFLGLTLPQLVQPDLDLSDELLVWHQDVAWALLALALLHASAALWHHLVRHDAVLRSMLPRRRRG